MTDLEYIELALRNAANRYLGDTTYPALVVSDALRDVADELKRVSEKRKQDNKAESDIDT